MEQEEKSKTETEEVAVRLTRDNVLRMMEIFSTQNKSTAVLATVKVGLWVMSNLRVGDYHDVVSRVSFSDPLIDRITHPHSFRSEDDDITIENLKKWRDLGESALHGCGLISDEELEQFHTFFAKRLFVRSNGERLSRRNVWNAYKTWHGIELREEREKQEFQEARAKAERDREDREFQVNKYMLSELPDD